MAKFSVNLSDIEAELLRKAARESGRAISAEIRMAVVAWLYQDQSAPPIEVEEPRPAVVEPEVLALMESMVTRPESSAPSPDELDTVSPPL